MTLYDDKMSILQEDIIIINIYVHQSTQIYEANIDRTQGRNRQQHNNSKGFQCLNFNNG